MKTKVNVKKIGILLLSLIFLVNVFLLMKDNILGEHQHQIYNVEDTINYIDINPGTSIEQKFNLKYNQIDALMLNTSQLCETLNEFILNYRILDENKEVLYVGSIDLTGIGANTKITMYLDNTLSDIKNMDLLLELSTQSYGVLSLVSDTNNNIGMGFISNEKTDYAYVAITTGIILILLTVMLYCLIYFFHFEIYKIFLISGVSFGLIICFFIPIGNVPDEANAHITTAYHYSNVLLGIKDDKNNVKERTSDLNTVYSYVYIDNEKFIKYIDDMTTDKSLNYELVDSNLKVFDANLYSFTYYLSALGIAIGRILGLNGVLCLLLGRLFNFILFMGVATYCIKKIPIYKGMLTFVCLLPITLQQAFSLSYDSMVITLALLIITFTVKLYYNKKLSNIEYGGLVTACLLISLCKSFSYSPIVLAPLSFYMTKLNLKNIFIKNKILIFCTSICALVAVAFVFIYLRNNSVEGSMLYLIGHPMSLYLHIRETLHEFLEMFLSTALGGSLGLMSIKIYVPIMICYYILVFYVLRGYSDEKNNIFSNTSRFIFVIIFLIVFFGILLAMYNWSYKNNILQNNIILGFQGRYMIPVMPLLLMALCKGECKREISFENRILYSSIFLNTLTIFSILICLG